MRARLAALVAAALALGAAGARAAAPAPRPDSHDRTVAAALDAQLATFKKVLSESGGSSAADPSLKTCPALQKDPKQALGAAIMLIPVLFTELVNDYKPQLVQLRDALASMHPDNPVFRQWLAAEGQSAALILQFDNGGKKVDACQAITVLLDKSSTDADVYRVLGIHRSLIGRVFTSSASATVTKLDPQVRTFLVAAGVSRANATALTS